MLGGLIILQSFYIRINGAFFAFNSPAVGGFVTFPSCRDILISYIHRCSKNYYEVVVSKKSLYKICACSSCKEVCKVLQIEYNG